MNGIRVGRLDPAEFLSTRTPAGAADALARRSTRQQGAPGGQAGTVTPVRTSDQ